MCIRDSAVSTEQWKAHLLAYYADNAEVSRRLQQVDFDAWIYGEGTKLPVAMEYDTTLARDAYELADAWRSVVDEAPTRADAQRTFAAGDMDGWNANQKVVFLEQLASQGPLPKYAVQWLDEAYALADNANDEIPLRFFELALATLHSGYEEKAADWVRHKLTQVKDKGRMKYCRAIYKALYKANAPLARKTFAEHRSFCTCAPLTQTTRLPRR